MRLADSYTVCENFINKSKALVNLGVGLRDNFGCEFTSYNRIPNYLFDCTVDQQWGPVCPGNGNQNFAYETCVGDITEYQ